MPATAAAARRIAARAPTAPARTARATPARTARPAPARARPARRPAPRPARRARQSSRPRASTGPGRLVPLAVGRTAVAVGGLADSGAVVRLTRGRLWIGLLTALLVGIVALNVFALSFSASATGVGRENDVLARQNSALRAKIANGLANDRIQRLAQQMGYVVPDPGGIGYLKVSSDDAAVAAKRLASGDLTSDGAVAPPPVTAPTTETVAPPAAPATTAPAPTATDTTATDTTATADTTATSTTSPTDPTASADAGGTAAGGVAAP